MRVEFTPEQWAARTNDLRKVRIRHECSDPATCHVFVCRDRLGYSCGRHCCQGVGGGDDNRCAKCWSALEKNLTRLLLEHLSMRTFAREGAICRRFGCYWTFGLVEDFLADLVYHELAVWFGPEDARLKYRITDRGRDALRELNRRRPRSKAA